MGGLFDLLTGAFGGSLIGALGATFNKWQEHKSRMAIMKLEIIRDKQLNSHELEMNRVQAETRTKELEYEGLTESLGMDKATYSVGSTSAFLVFVDGVRGLVRPVLTATLLVYCMVVLFYLTKHYNVELAEDQVYKLVFMLVENLVVCSGIALTWWFGSRPANDRIK